MKKNIKSNTNLSISIGIHIIMILYQYELPLYKANSHFFLYINFNLLV